jgi:G3E family GTPase
MSLYSDALHDHFGRPVRRPEGGRIPVTIFTGSLGAGKTSIIRRLIEAPEGRDSAIIVNEFGEIGLDQAILSEGGESTILLGNGCLCCTVRTDLQQTLRNLFMQRVRGVLDFKRVIIETSGLADPGPILQTFLTDRAVGQEFYLRGLVAVADAMTFSDGPDMDPLTRKQIVLADRVVISKTDIASSNQTEAVVRIIQELVPGRPVVPMDLDNVDPDFLLREDLDLGARRSGFFADSVEHRDGVLSFPVFFDDLLPWDGFVEAIRVLAQLRGRDLLRVKGLVAIEGCQGPVVIHVVQHLVHDPIRLRTWPDADQRSRLVFITRGIYPGEVETLFSTIFRFAKGVRDRPGKSL